MISTLIEYSSFRLKKFTIRGDPDAYEQGDNFLRPLLSLKVLELRFWHYGRPRTEELLNLLCCPCESPPFLPHLQTLKFGNTFSFKISWESVSRILASSHKRSLCVKIDNKYDTRGMTNECVDQLLELVNNGFDLTVTSNNVDILKEHRVNQRCFQPPSPSPSPTTLSDTE